MSTGTLRATSARSLACSRYGWRPSRRRHVATAGSLLKLDEADLYIGIAAFRYGHVETGHERSVTHEEYRQAGERGLERLCFVMDADHPWPRSRMDADLRAADAFHTEMRQEIIGWFTTVDDFARRLSSALAAWKQRTAAVAANHPGTPGRFDGAGRNEVIKLRLLCSEMPLHVLLDCYRGAVGNGRHSTT